MFVYKLLPRCEATVRVFFNSDSSFDCPNLWRVELAWFAFANGHFKFGDCLAVFVELFQKVFEMLIQLGVQVLHVLVLMLESSVEYFCFRCFATRPSAGRQVLSGRS